MGRKNRRIEEKLSKLPTEEELRRETKSYIKDSSNNRKNNNRSQHILEKSNKKSAGKNYSSSKDNVSTGDNKFSHHSMVMEKSIYSLGKTENTYYDNDSLILRGSIWLATLETHIGTSVQGGFRPVIVVSNDVCNKFSKTVTVVPLTSIIKRMKIPTHVLIPVTEEMKLVKPTMVMAEQVMTIDKTSLKKYLSRINDRQLMDRINNAIRIQLML